jgi:hypothetical protein
VEIETSTLTYLTSRVIENFCTPFIGEKVVSRVGKPFQFKGSSFHRVIPFMCQDDHFTIGNCYPNRLTEMTSATSRSTDPSLSTGTLSKSTSVPTSFPWPMKSPYEREEMVVFLKKKKKKI